MPSAHDLGEPTRHLSLERQDTLSPPPRYALNPAVLGEGVEHGVDHRVLVAPPDYLALQGGARGVWRVGRVKVFAAREVIFLSTNLGKFCDGSFFVSETGS